MKQDEILKIIENLQCFNNTEREQLARNFAKLLEDAEHDENETYYIYKTCKTAKSKQEYFEAVQRLGALNDVLTVLEGGEL